MPNELNKMFHGQRDDNELLKLEHRNKELRKRLISENSLDPNAEYKEHLKRENAQMSKSLKQNNDGSVGYVI